MGVRPTAAWLRGGQGGCVMKRFFFLVMLVAHTFLLSTVVSAAAASIATADGGWVWQNPKAGDVLTDICFVDSTHGWALSPRGILTTSDGGTTWASQWRPSTFGVDSLCFVDQLHGWAVGDDGKVLVTAARPRSSSPSRMLPARW